MTNAGFQSSLYSGASVRGHTDMTAQESNELPQDVRVGLKVLTGASNATEGADRLGRSGPCMGFA
jgi:hypothetical protein